VLGFVAPRRWFKTSEVMSAIVFNDGTDIVKGINVRS
jgi:hypothetical protein